MKKTNEEIFNSLSNHVYFKSNNHAAKFIKDIQHFKNALGYSRDSDGFIVFHRHHSPSALENEIPACLILKNLGFGVILLDETTGLFVPDAKITTRYFELKRLSKAKNIKGAINEHFRKTYKKAENLILHIDQKANPISLKSAIIESTKKHHKIRSVWIIYFEKLWRLDRKVILKGEFNLK